MYTDDVELRVPTITNKHFKAVVMEEKILNNKK